MKNILLIAFLISSSLSLWSQKATESKETYTVTNDDANKINLYFEAIKAKNLNDFEKAASLIEQYLAIETSNAAAYYEAAQIYLNQENEIRTKTNIEKAIELDPKNKWYNGFYIEFLNKIGDYSTAIKVLEKNLKGKDNEFEKMQYSYMLLKNGDYKKALNVLEDMEKTNEGNESILMQKFQIYYKLNDKSKAENELRKIISIDPTNVQSYINLAEYHLENKNLDEATKMYKNILLLEPSNPQALIYLTGAALKSGDTVAYKMNSRKIIQNNSVNIDTKIKFLGMGLMTFDKLDSNNKAFYISMAEDLAKANPTEAKASAILGDFYFLNNNYEKAYINYKKTLSLKSDNYDVWQNLFSTQLSLKKYKELADSTVAAIEFFPAHSSVYFYNSIANQNLENYTQAEKSLKKALRFVGEDKNFEAQIQANLAETYHKLKNYEASDAAFEEAIKIDPNNVYSLNNYAYYLSLRKEKLETAKKMSRKSLDISPKNANFIDTYAWICFQMEKYDEAKIYQEQALELEKEDKTTIYEHYGDILFKLNDTEKALIYWNKAKENGSKSKVLPSKIATKKYIESQE